MPSPFPGMDPYIESPELWSDFHNNLASEMQAQLNRLIQPRCITHSRGNVRCARVHPAAGFFIVRMAQTTSR